MCMDEVEKGRHVLFFSTHNYYIDEMSEEENYRRTQFKTRKG